MNTPTILIFSPITNSGAHTVSGAWNMQKTHFEMSYDNIDGAYDVFPRNLANSISGATGYFVAGAVSSPEAADAGKVATGTQDSYPYKFANVPCFTRDISFSGGTTYSNRMFFGTDAAIYTKVVAGIWYKSTDGGLTWTNSSAELALPIRRLV